jgi:hypothetical protein
MLDVRRYDELILSVSSPTKLLNYINSPDTVIWSALLASAAVPGIINPVVIMNKLRDGCIVPWNWGSRFKDGSLRWVQVRLAICWHRRSSRVDIPLQALNLYFNGKRFNFCRRHRLTRTLLCSHASCSLSSEPACSFVLFRSSGFRRETRGTQ